MPTRCDESAGSAASHASASPFSWFGVAPLPPSHPSGNGLAPETSTARLGGGGGGGVLLPPPQASRQSKQSATANDMESSCFREMCPISIPPWLKHSTVIMRKDSRILWVFCQVKVESASLCLGQGFVAVVTSPLHSSRPPTLLRIDSGDFI